MTLKELSMTSTSPSSSREAAPLHAGDWMMLAYGALALAAIAVLSAVRVPWLLTFTITLVGVAWIVPGRTTRARYILTALVVIGAGALYLGIFIWTGQIGGYSVQFDEL